MTTFYEAQDRHRRSARLLSLVSLLAVVVLAAAAAVAVSPFAVVLVAAVARLVDLAITLPPAVWDPARVLVGEFARLESAVRHWPPATSALPPLLSAMGRLVIPGFLAIVILWFALWRVMLGAAASIGPAISGLRHPERSDVEEQQLENVVESVSLAAGMARPRVLVVDAEAANAGVFGLEPSDTTLVVSRGLLRALDRSETEAVLSHLFAQIADGDLRLNVVILSVANTFGLLTAFLDAPLSPTARGTLWRVLKAMLRRAVGLASAGDDATLGALLAGRVELGGISEIGRFLDDDAQTPRGTLFGVVRFVQFLPLLPLFLAGLVTRVILAPLVFLLIGPLLSGTLRSRRLLADAVAIQLSRDPDSLAQALRKVGDAKWAGSPAGGAELAWIVTGPAAGHAHSPLWFVGSHPPLITRLRHLRRLGASVDLPPPSPAPDVRRPASETVADSRSTNLLVAIPLLLLTLTLVAVVLIAGVQFFLYMIGVTLFAAALLIGGLYFLAFSALRLLLP